MEKKTTGIIATVVSTLLCGCPGLFTLCWGAIAAIAGLVPGSDIDFGGSRFDPTGALITGVVAICGGIILVAIPVVVGFLTLQNKSESEEEATVIIESEPFEMSDPAEPAESLEAEESEEPEEAEEPEEPIPPAI